MGYNGNKKKQKYYANDFERMLAKSEEVLKEKMTERNKRTRKKKTRPM